MTTRCQKAENRLPDTSLRLLTNFVSWKLAQLIFKNKTRIRQKVLRLKTWPQGDLKPSRKNRDFGFLPIPSKPAWLKNDHLTQTQLWTLTNISIHIGWLFDLYLCCTANIYVYCSKYIQCKLSTTPVIKQYFCYTEHG